MSNGSQEPDFDALWAEETGEEVSQNTEQNQPVDDDPPAQPQDDSTGEEQGAASGAGDGGEGGGTRTEQPATDAPGEGKDWIDALPEDARARILAERQDAENRLRALHGRLAPTQRQLSEAQQRLAELQQAQQAAQQAAQQHASTQQAQDSYFDSESFKRYEEDFPVEAKVMREAVMAEREASANRLSQLEQQVQQLTGRVHRTEQVSAETAQNEELSRLEAKHPDWQEWDQSDEFWDYFDEWRSSQPKSVQADYMDRQKLVRYFADADFVSARLDEFKAKRQQAASTARTDTPAPKTEESAQDAPAQRQPDVRLQMGVAPEVKGHGQVPRGVPLESLPPEQQFDHLWNTMDN